ETHVWPTSETIPDLGSYGMTALRGVLSGIPNATQAGDMTLGALRFTAPPTIHAAAGTHWPVVHQRFALDFVPPARGTQPAVALTGTLQLGIGVVSSVRPAQRPDGHWGSNIQITFGKIPQPPARVDAEKLHIVVDSSSTVQFRSWDHTGIETILDNWF